MTSACKCLLSVGRSKSPGLWKEAKEGKLEHLLFNVSVHTVFIHLCLSRKKRVKQV